MKGFRRFLCKLLTIFLLVQCNFFSGFYYVAKADTAAPAWSFNEIGSSGTGSDTYSDGEFVIKGKSSELGGKTDKLSYTYQNISKDCSLSAQITDKDKSSLDLNSGIMYRENLDDDSKFFSVFQDELGFLTIRWRSTKGEAAKSLKLDKSSFPIYLKIVRIDDTFTVYKSKDGMNWGKSLASLRIIMNSTIYAGMFVTCNDSVENNGAKFNNVDINEVNILTTKGAKANLSEPLKPEVVSKSDTTISFKWSSPLLKSNLIGYEIYRDNIEIGFTTDKNYADINLSSNTKYSYTIKSKDSSGNLSKDSEIIQVSTDPLPKGWTSNNIGSNVTTCSAVCQDGVFTISGAGKGIGSVSDDFQYTYTNDSGDYTLESKISDFKSENGEAKAGIMIRENSDADSPNVFLGVTSSNYLSLQWRTNKGGAETSLNTTISQQPYLKLVRKSNQFSAFSSADGITWTRVGSYINMSINSQALYGIAVASGDDSTLLNETIDSINVSKRDRTVPNSPQNLAITDVTDKSVSFSWDRVSSKACGQNYLIYRGGTLIDSTNSTTYIAEGLTANKTYSFTVKAVDSNENISPASAALKAKTDGYPSTPGNIKVASTTSSSVTLSWTASSSAYGIEQYDIYKDSVKISSTSSTNFKVTGLNSNTAYTFTVKSQDKKGYYSLNSRSVTVRTDALPTIPSNLKTTNISDTSVVLSFSKSQSKMGVAQYDVYNGSVLLGTTTTNSIILKGLTPSTNYVLGVVAIDKKGNESPLSRAISVLTASDTQVPSAPTNLNVQDKTDTTVTLSWSPSTDDVGVAAYDIYDGVNKIGSVQDSTNYTAVGLSPLTTYSFTVKARDASGNESILSNAVAAATLADTTAPTAPNNLISSSKTCTSVEFSWNASADDVGVAGYDIYNGAQLVDSTAGSTSYTIIGLSPDTAYVFTVKAKDAAGNVSELSSPLNVTTDPDTEPPAAPANLNSVSKTCTSVDISWDDSIDNVGVTKYDIFCGTELIGYTTGSKSYTAKGLAPNTEYAFTVKAEDAAGNKSEGSSVLNITTLPDTEAPTAPINVISTLQTCTSISLSWVASLDNVGVTEYDIYNGTQLIGTTSGSISYTLSGLTPNTSYAIIVKAKDEAGNTSVESNALNITTLQDTEAPTAPLNLKSVSKTDSSVVLAWDAATDNVGVAGYDIYNGDALVAVVNDTEYSVTNLTQGTLYTFTVKAIDAAENVSVSSNEIIVRTVDTQAPAAPANLKLVSKTDTSVVLSWDASTDNVGVVSYDVYNGSTYIATVNDTEYTVSGLNPYTNYTFTVKAKDADGNISDFSNSVTVKTAVGLVSDIEAKPLVISITLTWDAVPDAESYDLELDNSTIVNVTGTSYVYDNLTPNSTHYFRIRAKNADGIGSWSDKISSKTLYGTLINSDITQDTTWDLSGSPYIIDKNITVIKGVQLNIMPGVVVLGYNSGITVSGKVNAQGTADNKIVFSSIYDSVYGESGVTSFDNYWLGINITDTGEFNGDNIAVKYGSAYSNDNDFCNAEMVTKGKLKLTNSDISKSYENGIEISSQSDVDINNCNITGNETNGIQIDGYGTGVLSIQNNNIANNSGYPINIDINGITADISEIKNNSFSGNMYETVDDNGNVSGSGKLDGIGIYGSLPVDLTLINNEYIIDSTITVPSGKTLTIQPGAVILGNNSGITVDGKLNAIGTSDNKIVFSSINDSVYGGVGLTSSYECWDGIKISSIGELDGDNLAVKYGRSYYFDDYYGYYKDAEIVSNGKLKLTNSDISKAYDNGIEINSQSDVDIDNCNITGSETNGIQIDGYGTGILSIQNNNIANNLGFPISIDMSGINGDISGIKNNTFSGNVKASVEVDGIGIYGCLAADITLDDEKYIISDELTVPSGKTLTIQPGAVILAYNSGITVDGKLNALGTVDNKVIFSSVYDSLYGGSGVKSSSDYWRGIDITSTGEFNGDSIVIRYGYCDYGYNNDFGAEIFTNGKLNLTNSDINKTFTNGIEISSQSDININNCNITGNVLNGQVQKDNSTQNESSGICIVGCAGILNIQNNNITNNSTCPILINISGITGDISGIKNNTFSGNVCLAVGNSGNGYYTKADGIFISGSLQVDLTLIDNEYIIFGSLIVPSGKTLTIQPGAVILGDIADIIVSGKVNALGTSDNKIVFSSINDSVYGGSGETENSWNGIEITNTGEFNGDYIAVNYGQSCNDACCTAEIVAFGKLKLTNSDISKGYLDGIEIDSQSDVDIYNCNITANKENGIKIEGYGTGILNIQNNNITNNSRYPININLSGVTSDISRIKNNIFSGNIYGEVNTDGIGINGTPSVDLALINQKYIIDDVLAVMSGKTLTIQPGAVILGLCYYSAITVDGELNAIGTTDNPIVFSSIDDSQYGGGVAKDNIVWGWKGINVASTGEFNGDNVKIKYGWTSDNCSDIYVQGKLNLINSEVSNGYTYGICFNTTYAPHLAYNTIKSNCSYGVYNANPSQITIDASYNYWGSSDGPKVFDKSSQQWVGSGDKVSDGVTVYPYFQSQYRYPEPLGQEGTSAATGNFCKSFTDMTYKSTGFDMNIDRTYNSKDDNANGSFGRGWMFSYEGNIKDYTADNKIKLVKLPDGSVESFTLGSDGSYTANDSRNKLEKKSDGTYVLTTKDQHQYGFNTKGWLYYIKDRFGNIESINVDDYGKVHSIIDTDGRTIAVNYNAQGLIENIIDPSGRKVSYGYTNNMLTSVTAPNGNYSYTYDAKNFLSYIKDADGNIINNVTYIHDSSLDNDKVNQITDENGNVNTYSYDNPNRRTTITDKNGRKTVSEYDSSNYVTKTTDPEGKVSTTEYSISSTGINKYGEERVVTDRNGNETIYNRDSNGNITSITNPDGSIKTSIYDSKNNLIQQKDENGKLTYYVYDTDGRYLLKKVQPLNGTDIYSSGCDETNFAVTNYTYYSDAEALANGYGGKWLLKSETDPDGNITTYTYDDKGNVKTVTDGKNKTTTYNYNVIGWKTSAISPMKNTTAYEYSDDGQVSKTVLQGGEISRTIYDSMGRKIKEISANQYDASQDAAADVGTRYTYYPSGKIKTQTDAQNNTTSFVYDEYGNISKETMPSGAVYKYDYDVMNRLIKTWLYDSDTPVLMEEDSYDILADGKTKKTQIKHLNSTDTAVTIFIYDYSNRLVEQDNADGTTVKTSYNANGTKSSDTEANGSTIYYKYDGLNRLTDTWTPFENDNGIVKYSYTGIEYDKAGNKKVEKSGIDKVLKDEMPTNCITKNYVYDGDNKVISVVDNEGRKTEYQYDDDGNVNKETSYVDPNKTIVTDYVNNYFGKPDTETKYVSSADLYNPSNLDAELQELKTSYTYDKNGNVKTVTTPDSVVTTYGYDNLNRQTSVNVKGTKSGESLTTSKTYNWQNKELTVTDANGNTTTNYYDARGLLCEQVDAKGGVTREYYDLGGRKIAEVQPNAAPALDKNPDWNCSTYSFSSYSRTEFTYDNMDRLKLQRVIYKDPASGQINNIVTKACRYDASGNLIKDMDALGFENASGSSDDDKINNGYGTEYAYNLAGKMLTELDAVSKDNGLQFSTKYDYDALGRKIAETDAKGHITSYTYNNSGKVLTKNIQKSSKDALELLETDTYDLQDNLTSKKDGNGNVISYTYNAFNKISQEVYPGDDTILPNTVTKKYDVMGNLMESQDSTGNKHLYTYDFKGNQLSDTESKTDGSEAITTSVTYDGNSNKTTETDGNNVTKTTTYNALNKVHTVTTNVKNSAGILVPQTTTYEYDANGNKTSETDWLGNTISYQYDPLNRLIQQHDQLGKLVERLEYYDNGSQSKDYDALGNVTTYEYDKDKRLIKTTDPENHVTSQSYDAVGNIQSKTDGNNNVTSYTYNELNKLSTVTNAKGEVTSYTYDLNGNKLTQTDGKGNTISYEYNAANKLARRIDQGGRTGDIGSYGYLSAKVESYTYYADGSMKTKLDRNGQTTNYKYDVHSRLLSETVGDISISYTYDNNGNQLTMTDSTGTTTRTYDELNRTTSKAVPNIGKTEYEYDIINGVDTGNYAETTTDPKGNVTKKVYDKTGRLYQVYSTTDANEVPTTYSYYDDGSEKSIVYPNGSSEEYTYFKDKTLQNLVNKKSDGTVINSYSYTYDNTKNILTKTEGKGTTSYSYDTLNRLQSVTEPNGNVTSYTYDAAGNRATETLVKNGSTTKTTYIYNEQNRLTDTAEATNSVLTTAVHYDYDYNGNETSEQKSTYTSGQPLPRIEVTTNIYDALNELTKTITPDGKTVNNTYNGDGLRTGKETENGKTQYLYEGDKVILETDGSGNQTARNVQGTNLISRTTAEIETQQDTTAFYYYNGHADVTKLLNSTGKEEGSYDYDAFGNLTESSESINNPFRYAGYEYDKETNTYYLKCRMYDPETGRFLQEDSYSGDPNDPLSLNLYTYCHNEPLMYNDPTGHFNLRYNYDDAGHYAYSNGKTYTSKSQVKKAKTQSVKVKKEVAKVVDKPYKNKGKNIVDTIKKAGNNGLNKWVNFGNDFLNWENSHKNVMDILSLGMIFVPGGFEKADINVEAFDKDQEVISTGTEILANEITSKELDAEKRIVEGEADARLIPGQEGIVTGGNSTKLGKNMLESMGLKRSSKWSGYQAQHVIPTEMRDNAIIEKIGMNLDDASNGIFLRTPDEGISTMSRQQGYHSVYNEVVERQLNNIDVNQSVDVLQKQVYDLQQNLRYLQEQGLPLYPSQGATVDLWERQLNKIK